MFPDLQIALQAEEAIKAARAHPVPASGYPHWKEHAHRDIIEDFRSGQGLIDLSAICTASSEPEIYLESHDSPLQTNSSQISVSSPRGVNGGSGVVNGSLNGDDLPTRPYTSLVEERLDSISDNMSYMSLEVNTTGTGSVRVTFLGSCRCYWVVLLTRCFSKLFSFSCSKTWLTLHFTFIFSFLGRL